MNQLKYIIDGIKPDEWDKISAGFDDANIYQTFAYHHVSYGVKNTSTLVVIRNNEPISAALIRILKLPGLPMGLAYVPWGPLWQRNGMIAHDNFEKGLHALYLEYVKHRGLALIIKPYIYEDSNYPQFEKTLRSAGFQRLIHLPKEETFIVDLSKSLDDLRRGLDSRWRGHLSRAEKNNLTIIEGVHDNLFVQLNSIQEELLKRKRISGIKTAEEFRKIQPYLPEKFKMRVFLCEEKGTVCAGIIVSAIGKTGITLVRATNNRGRELQAAYLVQWRALQWLKGEGCNYYDLGGINEKLNPGTYSYKKGLCGKNGRKIYLMPQYEICPSRIMKILLKKYDQARLWFRFMRQNVRLRKIFDG